MENDLTYFGTRSGFNMAIRHCKKVIEYNARVSKSTNLADIINNSLDNQEIQNEQINPVLGMLIADKYGYNFKSINLPSRVEDFEKIVDETSKWTGIDMIVSYYHPKLKQCVINPKVLQHWQNVADLSKDEILVVYAKVLGSDNDIPEISSKAIDALFELVNGNIPTTNKDFIAQGVSTPKPKPEPAAAAPKPKPKPTGGGGKKRMSGKVSVQVSNELFHNGNVEAWKNIIESYNHKYPNCEVVVFYDNEVINNLNALFKWGKVKMGNVIIYQVIGSDFKDVSKLKRYLYEGASHRYEKFLEKPVNKILNLF